MKPDTDTNALPKPTRRRYASIDEMMRKDGTSDVVQSKYREIADATRVATQLAQLRQKAGLTQEQMAARLNISQSAVSKLESCRDEDLTLGQISEYASATGESLGIHFGKPPTHVEAIKHHASGMRHHLSALAKLAHNADELETSIRAFFGEAFFNILNILIETEKEMPNSGTMGVRLEIIDTKSQSAGSSSKKKQRTPTLAEH